MNIVLENEFLIVGLNRNGAEITSIKTKEDNTEYIWNGNPKFWGRHAPVLFPIVGKVKNNKYKIDDKTYSLNQHGFARDLDFSIIESSKEKVLLRLPWSEKTLNMYPYKFELDIQYCLKGNTLDISYIVKNVDTKDIYFSIGAHPGFNYPLESENANSLGTDFEDYYFEFENNETTGIIPITSNGLLKREVKSFLNNTNKIHLTNNLFQNDALVFNNLKSQRISLKNTKNSKSVTVNFSGFPYLGLWSKAEGAPFVCIEPWFGHADLEDFEGDFTEKDGVLMLKVGEEFNCKYSISVE